MEKERAERRVVEFNRELEKIQGELPGLCEKYALQSINEPIAVDWSEDSLRLVEGLMPYLAIDEYKSKALQVMERQRVGIERSREADFEQLLLSEFKSTNDSLAVKMRSALVDPTDDQLLIEAGKWYELTK